MSFLFRSALIVRRKTPYLDWANGLADTGGVELTVEIAETPTIYLGPDSPVGQKIDEVVGDVWEAVFDEELYGWATDEKEWPLQRSLEMFHAWFAVELADSIVDLVPEDPLTEEEVEAVELDHLKRACAWCATELWEDAGRIVAFPLAEQADFGDREGRVLSLLIGRDRILTGVVTGADTQTSEVGTPERETPEPKVSRLVFRACSRPCEKHMLRAVPRPLKALEEARASARSLGE